MSDMRELYQEVLEKDSANSQAYYQLARIYWAGSQSQKALDSLQEGLAAADSPLELDQGRSLLHRFLSESPEQ